MNHGDPMNGDSTVAVLIINWNQDSLVLRAVESALKSARVRPVAVVIDNGSSPESQDRLLQGLGTAIDRSQRTADTYAASLDGRRHVIFAESNLGFTGANNLGLAYAFTQLGVDYCFLLNADAHLDEDALHSVMETAASHPDSGLVGCLILDGFDGRRISFARSRLSLTGWPTSLDHGRAYEPSDFRGVSETELVGGAAMLIPRRVYERIGGQDDRYFFDVDDTEISLRTRSAGFKNYMSWDAICFHEMGSSVQGRSYLSRYYNLRNLLLLSQNYLTGARWLGFRVRFMVRIGRDILAGLLRRDWRRVRIVGLAIRDYRAGRFGIGPREIYSP